MIVHIRIFVSNIGKEWAVTSLIPGSPANNCDIDKCTLSSDHENELSIFFLFFQYLIDCANLIVYAFSA